MRCRGEGDRRNQKNGWYSLHELHTSSGQTLIVGAFGNWRTGVDANGRPRSERVQLKKHEVTGAERAAIRQRIAEESKAAEARRIGEQRRAARRAENAWKNHCTIDGESSYLKAKGVQGYSVRYSKAGNLVLPIHDNQGRIHGLQVIYSDPAVIKRKGRNKDFWPAGLAKRGHYFLIGAPTWICLVAEGYATAATLHEATGLPVAVAWDAGNLLPVCQAIKHRYREANILICADDDYKTDGNPGVSAASAAALAVSGSWIKPEFSDRQDKKLTDFNDLHATEHIDKVRAQLESCIEKLGWSAATPRADRTSGGAGARESFHFTLDILLDDFALIYGTETVFDGVRHCIITLSSLRSAAGRSLVRMWLEHPGRRVVMPEKVVFDPTETEPTPGRCNLFEGWPTQAQAGACDRLLELLEYLCSDEDNPDEVYNWVLDWCAYPIQHPGAKMQTAILMHGGEGTGKNTFFNSIRNIYGTYGGSISQTELESQFNGWAHRKLFLACNEVVTRAELYHVQGRLKNMITESEWSINEKNLPVRQEQNHCNFAFFSNRIDIAKLDKDDRRYCVVWTPPALSAEFMREVYDEIDAGAVAALHHNLLTRELGDFAPWAKPPLTRAKRELIELGMDSVERFWRDWEKKTLPIPFTVVRSEDLYDIYRFWAMRNGIPKAAPAHVLQAAIAKKQTVEKRRSRYYKRQKIVQSTFIWPVLMEAPDPNTQRQWLSEQIETIQNALSDWKEGLF